MDPGNLTQDMKHLNHQVKQCASQRFQSKPELKIGGGSGGRAKEVISEQRKLI